MFSFDGRASGRKKIISLGGARSRASTADARTILEESRAARERRARERDVWRATLVAQRTRRGTRDAARARATRRAVWDANASVWDDGDAVDAGVMERATRELGFFGRGEMDWRRAAACAAACADADGFATEAFVVAHARLGVGASTSSGADAIERCRALIRASRLVRLMVSSLGEATRETNGRDATGALSRAIFALMRRDDARLGADVGVSICAALCTAKDLARVREVLVSLAASAERAPSEPLDAASSPRVAMRLLCENMARCGAGGELAWTLASIPRVWDAFGGEGKSRELYEFVVEGLASNEAPPTSDELVIAPFRAIDVALGNVMQPVKLYVDSMDLITSRALVRAMTNLMASPRLSGALFVIDASDEIEEDENAEDEDDDDDDDELGGVKVDALNLKSVRAERRKAGALPPGTSMDAARQTPPFAQVRNFFGDATTIARLVRKLLPSQDAEACAMSSDAFASFVFTCDLTLRGVERQQFLRVLTFGTDCFNTLWPTLARSSNVCDRAYRRLLGVFAKFYNMYTIISDDEEFYRLGKPLGLEATTTLVTILRDALWQLLWIERGPNGTPLSATTFTDECIDVETLHACSVALARLHDRNGRHQFMNPLAFQMNAAHVDIPALLYEARDPKSRASMLLSCAPCLVPFEVRVHKFMDARRSNRQLAGAGYTAIRVRRGHLLEDGVNALSSKLTETLGGIIRVQFVNQQGLEEAGVDGGGLFKDFLNDLIAESFDPKFGLFAETPERTLYPNPASEIHAGERHLQYFYFLGAILGKACYEGILLDVPLAGFFLSSLKGRHVEFNDLTTLDPELYRNLVSLKRYDGNVEDLCLYFTAIDRSGMEDTEIELIPNGSNTVVTKANVPRYLNCMSVFLLRAQMYRQLASMKAGFEIMMRKRWLNMFTPAELRLLISGNRTGSMDIADMAASCEFSGGYDSSHPTIQILWSVMRELAPEEQRQVLKFITSCSNTPLLGFSHLEPRLCIHRSGTSGTDAPDETADLSRLPTAATCMNLLKLPPYKTKAMLKEKLLYAAQSGSGFDLS